MPEIQTQSISLDDASPFFAYRRILGLEKKRRIRICTYIEEEFSDMWPSGTLYDAINQGRNRLAVEQGKIE